MIMSRLALHWQIAIALVLAIFAGIITGKEAGVLGVSFYTMYAFLGDLFLNALKMLIVPLIMSSIISGVAGWRFHDLRRSFATHSTERLGISPVIADKILNHVTGQVRGVASIYQHGEYLEERRAALQKWGTFIQDLVADE